MSFIPFFFLFLDSIWPLSAGNRRRCGSNEQRRSQTQRKQFHSDVLANGRARSVTMGLHQKSFERGEASGLGTPRGLREQTLTPAWPNPPSSFIILYFYLPQSLLPLFPFMLSSSSTLLFLCKKLFFLISPCALLFLSLQSWHYIMRLHRRAS